MQCVRLNQHTLQFDGLQQLPQGLNLTTSVSGVGGLGNRHAQALGVEAHLSDETCCAGLVLGNGAPYCLAIADQGVELLGHTRLGRHPVTQQAFKARHIQLRQQQAKGGIRRRLAEIRSQQLVERLAVAFGESLHPHQ